MGNGRNREKKITYKGNVYVGTLRDGKVKVCAERTARGQNLLVGTFDIYTHSWHNESRSAPLPPPVKETIESTFSA